MVTNGSSNLLDHESMEEDPKKLAFYNSLIKRQRRSEKKETYHGQRIEPETPSVRWGMFFS